MDTKKLMKEWESEKPFPLCSYLKKLLPESYEDPYAFWSNLVENVSPPLCSFVFDSYKLYEDCITRHLDSNHTALKILGDDEQTWSYMQLDTLVEQAIPAIDALGPTVALPHTHSLNFLIMFLGALKLGKALTFTEKADELPNEIEAPSEKIETASYNPEDPLFIHKGYTLDANTAFLCALRDGFFHLHLRKGTTYARPLSIVYDDEPSATLAALLAGATLVYIPNLDQIDDFEVDVLGISPKLEKKWIESPKCPSSKLKFWYKNPLYGTIHETQEFALLNKLEKKPTAHLLFDPLRGGITLASRQHDPQNILHPNFGIPFSLLQLNDSGEKSQDGVGYFHPLPSRQDTLILSSLKEGYWISTSTLPLKEGRPFPVQEIEAIASSLPEVEACVISHTRDPKDIYGSLFTLVLFTSPEAHPPDITPLLPPEYLPDHIVSVPLYPRRAQGVFNRELTLSEFIAGNFSHKQKLPPYQLLNRLRQSVRKTLC